MPEPVDHIDQALREISYGIVPRAALVTAALDQRRREKAEMRPRQAPFWKRAFQNLVKPR